MNSFLGWKQHHNETNHTGALALDTHLAMTVVPLNIVSTLKDRCVPRVLSSLAVLLACRQCVFVSKTGVFKCIEYL